MFRIEEKRRWVVLDKIWRQSTLFYGIAAKKDEENDFGFPFCENFNFWQSEKYSIYLLIVPLQVK